MIGRTVRTQCAISYTRHVPHSVLPIISKGPVVLGQQAFRQLNMQPLIALPATASLVYRAWSHKSLTPAGIAAAAATATVHAIHPWSVFFTLLVAFYLGGTTVTKVKYDLSMNEWGWFCTAYCYFPTTFPDQRLTLQPLGQA